MDLSEDFPGASLLRSRRLSLRGLRYGDINTVQALNGDPRVARWLLEPCHQGFFQVAAMIAESNRLYRERPGLGVWHASDDTGRFVGLYSLMPIEGSDEIEIGARLRAEFWGHLYSVEGARALCTHAFDTLRLPRLVGFCDANNAAVPSIFRRLGFHAFGDVVHFGKPARKFVLEAPERRSLAAESTDRSSLRAASTA